MIAWDVWFHFGQVKADGKRGLLNLANYSKRFCVDGERDDASMLEGSCS